MGRRWGRVRWICAAPRDRRPAIHICRVTRPGRRLHQKHEAPTNSTKGLEWNLGQEAASCCGTHRIRASDPFLPLRITAELRLIGHHARQVGLDRHAGEGEIETRCLTPLVRCASKRSARCARTDAFSDVTWMGRPSADHCRLDVAPRTKSHDRIHSGGGCSVRRTLTRQGWRVGSDHGWLERVRRTEPPSPVHHPQSAHRTSVARTPSEVGARSSEPMSNVKGPPQSLSIHLIPGH